jgi:hypothetical protein
MAQVSSFQSYYYFFLSIAGIGASRILAMRSMECKKKGGRPFSWWRVGTCGLGETKPSLMKIFSILHILFK